jgi:hypothetical protein
MESTMCESCDEPAAQCTLDIRKSFEHGADESERQNEEAAERLRAGKKDKRKRKQRNIRTRREETQRGHTHEMRGCRRGQGNGGGTKWVLGVVGERYRGGGKVGAPGEYATLLTSTS